MDNSINVYITVLSALLTGGLFILMIENLHLSSVIVDRYYSIMKPFYHKLTNYIKLMNGIKHLIRYDKTKSEYINDIERLINEITLGGNNLINSGIDLDVEHYRPNELDELCEVKINAVWYLISEKRNELNGGLSFIGVYPNDIEYEYLAEITNKYKEKTIDLELLADLSGFFFTDIYQPMQRIPYEYDYWRRIEMKFRKINIVSMSFNLLSILVLATLELYLNRWILTGIIIVNVLMFISVFIQFIKMDNKSRKIIRI